jgi:hypothetical protein
VDSIAQGALGEDGCDSDELEAEHCGSERG